MLRRRVNFVRLLPLAPLLAVLFACEGDGSRPDGLIPPDKMATILTEIHIAEARVTALRLRSQDSSILVYKELQDEIWKRNKVDTSLYRKSYSYYTTHPARLAEIYGQVEENLGALEKGKDLPF